MRIQIRPRTFIVSALRGSESVGFSVHPATNILVAKTQISIDDMRGVVALRPYLKLEMTGGTENVMTVVRFQYWKDGAVVYPTRSNPPPPIDRRFWGATIFQPTDVIDLRPYQRGDRLVGEWNVTADIAFFAKKTYQIILPKSFDLVKGTLRFQRLADFVFSVVSSVPQVDLDEFGRFARTVQDTGTTYSMDDM